MNALKTQALSDTELLTIVSGAKRIGSRNYLILTSNNEGWQSNFHISANSIKEAKFIASEYVLRIKGNGWKVDAVNYVGI